MLRVIVMTLALAFHCHVNAQQGDPVKSFEKIISYATGQTNSMSPVNYNEKFGLWAKKRFNVNEANYDIKKTDSLISPIVGIVNLSLLAAQTDLFKTKEEAESSTDFLEKFTHTTKISMNYSYNDGKWTFVKATYQSRFTKDIFVITPETMIKEPNNLPMIALHPWMPK